MKNTFTLSLFFFSQVRISLTNVAERKDKMRLGMTLTSNPKDNSFVVTVGEMFFQMLPIEACIRLVKMCVNNVINNVC